MVSSSKTLLSIQCFSVGSLLTHLMGKFFILHSSDIVGHLPCMSPGHCKPELTKTASTFANDPKGEQPKELGENKGKPFLPLSSPVSSPSLYTTDKFEHSMGGT